MDIDITSIVSSDSFNPCELSASPAEMGEKAGEITWRNNMTLATELAPPILDTEEKLQAMRDFARSSGGWNDAEIAAWTAQEINALFLQWLAGDVRECFDSADFSDWDWEQYEKDAEAGCVPSNIFRGTDGKIYFSLGY